MLVWPELSQDSKKGLDVKALQYLLKCSSFEQLHANGTFGETTRDTVMAFQQKHSVTPADGIVRASTWEKLTDIIIEQNSGEVWCVYAAQTELAKQYELNFHQIDGSYGPTTTDAVTKFQQRAGFTGADVDGKVGPKTWRHLICRDPLNEVLNIRP